MKARNLKSKETTRLVIPREKPDPNGPKQVHWTHKEQTRTTGEGPRTK